MKGKGHEVTARNIASGEDDDIARPLTTDPWDNAILIEEDDGEDGEAYEDRESLW